MAGQWSLHQSLLNGVPREPIRFQIWLMHLLSFDVMCLLYAQDSLEATKTSRRATGISAAHCLLGAQVLAFSLGLSSFSQNVRCSDSNTVARSTCRNLSIVRRSKPGLSDSCSHIACAGLQEASNQRRREDILRQQKASSLQS